jgi:hypothetical protein
MYASPPAARPEHRSPSPRAYLPGAVSALISSARDGANHHIQYFYVCGHKIIVQALQTK